MAKSAAPMKKRVKQSPGLLSERESEALRMARELAREVKQAPRGIPVRPDRSNRYVRPQ